MFAIIQWDKHTFYESFYHGIRTTDVQSWPLYLCQWPHLSDFIGLLCQVNWWCLSIDICIHTHKEWKHAFYEPFPACYLLLRFVYFYFWPQPTSLLLVLSLYTWFSLGDKHHSNPKPVHGIKGSQLSFGNLKNSPHKSTFCCCPQEQ